MKSELELRQDELVTNPHARLPICLCLDTSGSMAGEPIAELNEGVAYLFDVLKKHDEAKDAAEIAVVTFGGTAKKALDFAFIDRQQVPRFEAGGATPMADGVSMALDLLDKAKKEYTNAGLQMYRPWLVLMSDGAPTDPPATMQTAARRASDLVARRRLAVVPVGVGPAAHWESLAAFSPRRQPARLRGMEFEGFFDWLAKSIELVSVSKPTEEVDLAAGAESWIEAWRKA